MASAISQIELTAAALSITNPVTVRMTSLGSANTSIKITVVGSYIISGTNISLLPNTYTIAVSGSGVTISTGSTLVYTSVGTNFCLSKQDSGTSGITIQDPYYYGRVQNYLGNMAFANENSFVVVYNYIDVETYLYGVVSQEMSDSFGIEALKAQAIAARTYVYNKNFFVTDDTNSQAYIGYNATYSNVISAVNATKNIVLTYQGNIVQSFYSASNGGYTDSSYYEWGTSLPYYQTQRDDYDYNSTITTYVHVFNFPKNVNVTTPLDSKISNLLDAPIKAQLSALGYTNTSSYTIQQFTNIVTNTPPNSRYPSNSPVHTLANITMNISVKNNASQVISIPLTVNGISLYSLSAAYGLIDSHIYEEGSNANYMTITGLGAFHSIGLSQLGAQQRAVDGQSYQTILSFYYVGTSTGTIDSNNDNWTTTGTVNLRSGPSTSYGIITSISSGTPMQILQAASEPDGYTWYNVQLSSSQVGYIRGDLITLDVNLVSLVNITVTPPTKTTYIVGQDLDLTGSKITANYSDNSSQTIAVTSDLISGYNKYNAGTQTVTITYSGMTASFSVTVNSVSLVSITVTPPTKTTYIVGQDLVLTGSNITANYNDNSVQTLAVTSAMISGYNKNNTGTQTVIVTYNGKTAGFTVTVNPVLLASITVTPPTKTTYFAGQDLVLTGSNITADYDDNSVQTIAVTSDLISGYNKNNTGTQTVIVTYNGKTASFIVTVNPLVMTAAVNSNVIINRTKNSISNIAPKTSVSAFLSLLSANGGTFKVLNAWGQTVSSGNVTTGTAVQLLNSQGQVVDTQTVIIYGDVNDDGNINLSDLVMIRDYLLNIQTMNSISISAGAIYGESNITLNDLVGMMSYFSGVGNINQNQ